MSGVGTNTKVKLYSNAREREHYENLADLYAIIKTVEHVEKAYIRDAITCTARVTSVALRSVGQGGDGGGPR